jgi:serine/threonine protein kinase
MIGVMTRSLATNRHLDWEILEEWIKEIASDLISPNYLKEFETIVISCTYAHFHTGGTSDHRRVYQLRALAFIYIVSAYLADYPIDLNTLHMCCNMCYDQQQIIQAIYEAVDWLGPSKPIEPMTVKQKIVDSGNTRCDLVQCGTEYMVRKRIRHTSDMVPAYDAMVELVAHYLLKTTEARNIAMLLHVKIDSHFTYLYYEYVKTPLSKLFCSDTCTIRRLVSSLLHGVRSLHSVGIAHRDLKSANIHVHSNRQVMLLDLGAAGHGLVRSTIPVCTITHRSPEILLAEVSGLVSLRYDGKKLDMWSIGVLLIELYTGANPFGTISTDTTPQELLGLIRRTLPSIMLKMKGLLPASQFTYFTRCMQEDPLERPTIEVLLLAFGYMVETK